MSCSTIMRDWRHILRANFTSSEKLADFLELDGEQRKRLLRKSRFVLNLPFRIAEKVEKGNLEDPLLRQFLPLVDENIHSIGFVSDPVGDHACRRGSKLLQKYLGRVLLVTTSACAMHCRYCFRQNFDYDREDKTFDQEIDCIRNDPTVKEVILSGGDPLSLPDDVLESLLSRLSALPQIKRIRFHSRFPIGIPERIDDSLLSILEKIPQQVWFVVHCNHPRELDEEIFERLGELQRRRIVVANQAVLLKGVNDDIDTLQELCEKLVDRGILPYYLFQLDRVQGSAHFEVEQSKGLQLMEELTKRLPGYAVPKYVREIPGESSKTAIHL